MRLLILIPLILITACSNQVIDMTEQPTVQVHDLSDPEGDGVIVARDKCPDTFTGALVNNDGCGTQSVESVRRHLEIHFDSASYVVKEEYFPEIELLAQFMMEHPQIKVTIEGHTSIVGAAEYNQLLSENRAEAIKAILIESFTIAAERISTVGYGFEQLLVEGNNEDAHERNRRIVADFGADENYINMKWHIYTVDEEVQ